MNEQAKKATKRTRRWLKVSLRTFLLAITVLCVWLGFIVNRVNKQKQAVEWVREKGGTVLYDFEWEWEKAHPFFFNQRIKMGSDEPIPPGPDWLREWIGIDYLAEVKSVTLCNTEITDVAPMAPLTDLCKLDLWDTPVSDLSPLSGMTSMEELLLNCTQLSDLSPLARMTAMQKLYLRTSHTLELSPLVGMTRVTIYRAFRNHVRVPPELEPQIRGYPIPGHLD